MSWYGQYRTQPAHVPCWNGEPMLPHQMANPEQQIPGAANEYRKLLVLLWNLFGEPRMSGENDRNYCLSLFFSFFSGFFLVTVSGGPAFRPVLPTVAARRQFQRSSLNATAAFRMVCFHEIHCITFFIGFLWFPCQRSRFFIIRVLFTFFLFFFFW